MRASDCYVLLTIHGIFMAHAFQSCKDTIANCGVSRLGVENEVYKAVFSAFDVTDDEGTRVQPLSETGAKLIGIRVAHEVDLHHWTSDVCLANPEQIRVGTVCFDDSCAGRVTARWLKRSMLTYLLPREDQ